MDKLSGGEPGLQFEVPPSSESLEPGTEQQIEKGRPVRQETAPSRLKQPPQTQPAADSQVPALPQPAADSQKTTSTAPITVNLPATDANLIEKEGVEAAKIIIAKTSRDPFSQKNEVSKIKADYIQKRFNKQVKTDEPLPRAQGDAVAA